MRVLIFFAVAIVPTGELFPCESIRVWDGDGPIWCADGPRTSKKIREVCGAQAIRRVTEDRYQAICEDQQSKSTPTERPTVGCRDNPVGWILP